MTGRVVLVVVGVLVLVVLAAGGILSLRDDDPPSAYDDTTEDDFMATCTADAEARAFTRPAAFCRCVYDRLVAEVPYDRYVELDEALAADPTAVPGQLDRIRSACFLGVETAPSLAVEPDTSR